MADQDSVDQATEEAVEASAPDPDLEITTDPEDLAVRVDAVEDLEMEVPVLETTTDQEVAAQLSRRLSSAVEHFKNDLSINISNIFVNCFQ